MKTFIQALFGSFIIHVIYILSPILIGYMKTRLYTPDVTNAFENVEYLQNEVAFGGIVKGSPWFLFISYLGVAIICGLVIILYKKLVSKRL
ncbi:hypothetical protein ACH0BF_24655 [Pseudobacillus sp. 179-B 2D1 NHS]|uniref:hypothetical protein n=1 Tax=Pseudobacillus sp. 179-B 2D1 NHS TaxID=3374292 RepID=UPI00387A8358